jgi:hypothetical protein
MKQEAIRISTNVTNNKLINKNNFNIKIKAKQREHDNCVYKNEWSYYMHNKGKSTISQIRN